MKNFGFLLIIFFALFPGTALSQSVDLLWHGDGYVPPFYKGRTLWSSQSTITLVAIPHGLGSSANLDFRWSRNGTVLGSLSGAGKNTLNLTDTVLSKTQNITIEIVSDDNETLAVNSASITPAAQSALVYENNPLYGYLFHREVSRTYPLKDEEVTFTAFPLLFNTESLDYQWRTNAGRAETSRSVTYRVPEGGSGRASISLNISNVEKILQSASRNFLVEFGEE